MDVPTLKLKMGEEFQGLWIADQVLRDRYASYQILHYEGMQENTLLTGEGKGGWRIVLNRRGGGQDFIWLRPSRTEPALRYLVDAQDQEALIYLEKVFDTIYQKTFRAGQAKEIFSSIIQFDQNDLEQGDNRWHKRAQLRKGLVLAWNNQPTEERMQQNEPLIEEIVSRRLRWYQEEDIKTLWTKDGEIEVTEDLLKAEILNQSIPFILNEILTNAFDAYARAGSIGPVHLSVKQYANELIIEVMDKGIGINFDVSKQTNKGWFLVANPRKAGFKREGERMIGVLWSQILVQLHGGTLDFLPADLEGYKTKVRITFPQSAIRINGESVQIAASKTKKEDEAMLVSAVSDTLSDEDEFTAEAIAGEAPGGIDLNPALLNLQIKRDSRGIPLPLYQQPVSMMKIEGFSPIIINIIPVHLPALLGLMEPENPIHSQELEAPEIISQYSQ